MLFWILAFLAFNGACTAALLGLVWFEGRQLAVPSKPAAEGLTPIAAD